MPTSNRIPALPFGRRRVLGLLLAACAVVVLPRAAFATAADRAVALVTTISAELTQLVNSGRSEAQMYAEFERLLARYADMPAVAAASLGPPWRTATSAQKSAYVAAFQTYLSHKYGRQFRDYRNARIEVTGARDGGNAGVLVNTLVVRPGQANIDVDWQISERSGSPKAVNLIIAGVSMLNNERAEIGAMLESQRGSIDGLISRMRARS
jgi:phospholipid transport system substrate-binding protein